MMMSAHLRRKCRSTALLSVTGLVFFVVAELMITGCDGCAQGARSPSTTNGKAETQKLPPNESGRASPLVSKGHETRIPESNPSTGTSAFFSTLKKARELHKEGQLEMATYYYLNAINKEPRDVNILLEYGELVEKIVGTKEKEGKESEAAEILEKLASLFYGQALQIDADSIQKVVSKAQEYQTRAAKLSDEEYSVPFPSRDRQAWEAIRQKVIGGVAPAVPETLTEAEEELRNLEPLLLVARENATSEDQEVIAWLEERLKSLKAVIAFYRAKSVVIEYLENAKAESSATVSAMILQQAELGLRDLAGLKAWLPVPLASEVTELTRQLKEAALEASNRQAKETSEKTWEEFKKEKNIDARVQEIKKWQPSQEVKEDRGCTQKLEELEALIREIQAMIPLLGDFQTREKVVDLLEDLNRQAERISKVRQNRYCRWALECIKAALEMYEKNKWWLNDNEVEFGNALVNELGRIDESLLTFETRRCYSEAFETIFGELGKVKSTDFEKPGTKMYVLKGMLEKEKKTYRDF